MRTTLPIGPQMRLSATSSRERMMPSPCRNPTASSMSWPGVRMVIETDVPGPVSARRGDANLERFLDDDQVLARAQAIVAHRVDRHFTDRLFLSLYAHRDPAMLALAARGGLRPAPGATTSGRRGFAAACSGGGGRTGSSFWSFRPARIMRRISASAAGSVKDLHVRRQAACRLAPRRVPADPSIPA